MIGAQEKKIRRIMIAAPKSGSGKTMITCVHCALPCLGLETPVIYLEKGSDIEESKCRLAGLRELFNVVSVENGVLSPRFDTVLPITVTNHPSNKSAWRKLADELKQRCREFV